MSQQRSSNRHVDDIITSAILVACEDGDAGALEQLTNVHRIHLNVANTLGETPMHVAAGAGHEHLIAFLTRRGCKVAVADKRGDTPIFWAARNGHANVIRCLLAHMAREATASATKNGKPPVVDPEVARLQSRSQMTSINCVNGSRESALHVATRYAQMEAVLALLELGIDADIEDEHGETVLHIASWHGYALLLSILCRFSPQMDLVNKDGESALHCAATRGHIECVNSLLEGGAPPDAQDQDGQTALHLALRRGHIDIALLLITKGCRLDVQDGTGDSALHIASQQGLCSCVQTLCHLGAPVDLQNQQALTPLHLAAKEGHIEVVRCLCLASANIHLKSKDGLTAEILALSQDHSQINSLLSRMKSDQTREQFIEQLQPLDTPLRRIKLKLFGHSGVGKTRLLQALQTTPTHSSFNTLMDGVRRWTSGSGGGGGASSSLSFDHSMQSPRPQQQSPHHLPPYNPSRSFQQQQQSQQQHRESVASTISALTDKTASSSGSSSAVNNGEGGAGTNKTDSGEETAKTTPTSATPSSSLADDNGGGISTSHLGKNIPGLVNAKYTKGIDVQNMSFPNCGEFSCWEFGGYDSYHIAYDHFVGNSDCIHVVVLCASDPTEVQYKQVLYWMNFLKGRVTPSEPISHCGVVSRRSKVLIVGTAANPQLFPERTPEGEWSSSDAEAMMQTIRLRFGTHFDICERIILVDENNASCPGMKSLRVQLRAAKENIVVRLQRPLALLEVCVEFLNQLRKRYATFPVITWPHFVNVVRCDLNPLASDSHCRQLIQQLQLIGEVVYLRDEASELDYVVLTPEWLGTHLLGTLLSFQFLTHSRSHGRYRASDFQSHFPEINEPADLLHILDTLQLCAVGQVGGVEPEFEFPAYILGDPPKDVWIKLSELPSSASAASSRRASREQLRRTSGRASSLGGVRYIYGGMRILPMRGMERSLQSTFPRIQVALRRSMNDFQDPMDAYLHQWYHCSKMCSGQMEALIRLLGDAVEIQLRGPADTAASCVYFLEDLANLVEQTASEVAPGICLERHFLSPKHLKEHPPNPPTFYPEQLMQMQQKESLVITNSDGDEEQFTDVVCFGSREVAAALTLGIDVSVSQLQLASRCELAALLDPPDAMGRDWSILAVKLNLTDQLPEVDSTGQSLSRTDQLLAEWALQSPDTATVGKLCTILEEMDRCDARDVLYRTVPLYLFAPIPSYDANTLQPNSPVPAAPNGNGSGGKQEGGGKSELHDSGLVVSSSSANSSSLVVDPAVSSTAATVSAKQ